MLRLLPIPLCLGPLGLIALVPSLTAATVYSALNPAGGLALPPRDGELGDQVALAGTDRLVTRLDIGLRSQPDVSFVSGDFRAQLYANDGPLGQPGSLLWRSAVTHIESIGESALLRFDVPHVFVPGVFTWTLQYINSLPMPPGMATAHAPTIGSDQSSWFRSPFTTVWSSAGGTYVARIEAVPGPRITQISRDGRISWITETNLSYQLQKTAQLGSGIWADVGAPLPGTGGTLSVTDSAQGSAQAFYRLAVTNVFVCTNSGGRTCQTAFSIGSLDGDINTCRPGPITTGCGPAWFRLRVAEANNSLSPVDLRVDVGLDSAPGINYDLYLYESCGSIPRSSTMGPGVRDTVFYQWDDTPGADNSRDFWIEIRQAAGSPSGPWTLRTSGGVQGPCY